jgi:hypothetical protein
MKNRPYALNGKTHQIILDHIPEPIYLTINDFEDEPYEVFLNCNDPEQLSWTPVASRLISAVMRNESNCDFLYKELQELFSAEYFFYHGKKWHSIVQLIGYILEQHSKGKIPTWD